MDVTLVLTHDCNLGCGYCYAGAKFNKRMPPEIADRAVELAFVDAPSRIQMSFFGGEPFLAYPQLVETARKARERATKAGVELRMSVTTNGTLLDDEKARTLADLEVYIALSIDGDREAHESGRPKMGGGSSFDEVKRGLDVLVKRALPFETISVVTPQNAHLVGKTVKFLFDAGVPRVGLNPCYEASFTDDELASWERGMDEAADAMLDWFRKGRIVSVVSFDNKILAAIKGGLSSGDKCSLGSRMVAVAPSGNLYSCERNVAEDENLQDVVGHVNDWAPTHEEMCARGPINEECGSCGERWRCASFCACSNKAETGRTDVAGGTQCWHERTSARIADRVAETLWKEQNPWFLAWFYGRVAGMVPAAEAEAAKEAPQRGGAPNVVPRIKAPLTARKRLVVVQS